MRCGSGRACGCVAFFPHHGVIHAAAAWPVQRKVGLVFIPASFLFCLFFVMLDSYQHNCYQSFQKLATMMKDNYEKLS